MESGQKLSNEPEAEPNEALTYYRDGNGNLAKLNFKADDIRTNPAENSFLLLKGEPSDEQRRLFQDEVNEGTIVIKGDEVWRRNVRHDFFIGRYNLDNGLVHGTDFPIVARAGGSHLYLVREHVGWNDPSGFDREQITGPGLEPARKKKPGKPRNPYAPKPRRR